MPADFTTPDTTLYLILGLAVAAVIMLVLVGSLILRFRNVQRNAQSIQKLSEE